MNAAVIISWIPAVLYMILLSVVSHTPGDQINLPSFPHSDKLLHFGAYNILGVLLSVRELIFNWLKKEKKPALPFIAAAAAGLLHGVFDEIHQIFVPLRDFSFWDMAANVCGVIFGILIYRKAISR